MSEDQARQLPTSELDLNLMLTDSVWGKPEVSKELKKRLEKHILNRDEKGKIIYIKDKDGNEIPVGTTSSLWGWLGFFTRDMRLGNLSTTFSNELDVCRYMINLANDFLTVDMIEPFLISISRSANILETSQSKGGFLRKMMNTLIQKQLKQELEPPKKGMFGGKKSNDFG